MVLMGFMAWYYMRDWTDFLLRMGFGPSTLPHSAHPEGWASCASGMDVLLGLSAFGKEGLEHLPANERSVLTGLHRSRRALRLPMWTRRW